MTTTRCFTCLSLHIICLILALSVAMPAVAGAPIDSFDATLKRHLNAIASRDLPEILATVADGDVVMVILPNGSLLQGKTAFADLHKEWFADPDWRMEFTEVRRYETEHLCSVLLRYSYRDTPEGPARECFLNLVFQRFDDGWLLVFDQNTRMSS